MRQGGDYKKARPRIRHLLRSLLWRTGFRVQLLKQAQKAAFPPHEPRLRHLLSYVYDTSDDFTIVIIGANDGVSFDWLYSYLRERNEHVRGIAVEPIAEYYDELCKNFSELPGIDLVHAAVTEVEGEQTMYKVKREAFQEYPSWKGVASLDPRHHMKTQAPASMIEKEVVKGITVPHLLESAGLGKVDYLQVDAEGYDGKILAMWPFALVPVRLIRFEHLGMTRRELNQTCDRLSAIGYRFFVDGNDIIGMLWNE